MKNQKKENIYTMFYEFTRNVFDLVNFVLSYLSFSSLSPPPPEKKVGDQTSLTRLLKTFSFFLSVYMHTIIHNINNYNKLFITFFHTFVTN